MPQPLKPPVPNIRRSLSPGAVEPGEVTRVAPSVMAPSPAPPLPTPESRHSRLPPPALPPKAPPLPPMRAPVHSDSGITLRREHAPEPVTAAIAFSLENTRPVSDRIDSMMSQDESTSVTKMHPLDLDQIAKSRGYEEPPNAGFAPRSGTGSSPSFGFEEPTGLFDRSGLDAGSQRSDSREPDSADFEASTRVVREERIHSDSKSSPPAPLRSPHAAYPAAHARLPMATGHSVVSSIESYSGSLSIEAIPLQSGDLLPLDEPSSPWARSSLIQPVRFDFGDDAPDSAARPELEFLPESLDMDPARPFRDSFGSPHVPLDFSRIDSSDVMSAPPSLEVAAPPSARPPAVAAPIAWGRHERKAPAMARGALPVPGRLAGRPRNLAGPLRAPKEQPAHDSYPSKSVQPAPSSNPVPVPFVAPAYVAPPAAPAHASPVYVAPSGAQLAHSPYGSDQTGSHQNSYVAPEAVGAPAPAHADEYDNPDQPSLPEYDDAPVSELPDPRGYAGAQAPVSGPAGAHGPYAPAPEWGADYSNGKRPDSSYREFPRSALSPDARGASSSEINYVGGKFIDESVPTSSREEQTAARVYEAVAATRRAPTADYDTRPRGRYDEPEPHFPAPPSSTGDASPSGGGGAYDSGISQQFQSLPVLPTARELLAQAAERGQPGMVGGQPPAPRAISSSVVAAPAPRSRVLWLAYSLLLGGVGMVALVHFTFGNDTPTKGPAASASVAAPASAAPPVPPYGYGQAGPRGASGYPPEGAPYVPGAVPPGYPPPGASGYPPGVPYGYAPPGHQPVYAAPTTVAPQPVEEASAKPKPKAPPKPVAPKPAVPKPAVPKPAPKDDEKPPSTSDQKPAKDNSGKANPDLLDDALN